MAERTEITCPGCGRVYVSQVRGDDTRCPGCGRSVYVRLDGTHKGQAPAAAAADVPEASDELGDVQGDVDPVEAELEPTAAVAPVEDLEDSRAGAGVDVAGWLWGGAFVAGLAALVWVTYRQWRAPSSPAPAAAVPTFGGFGWPG